MKKIIGITGTTGSGKSFLSSFLKEKGAVVLDADVISRKITARDGVAIPEIKEAFGEEVFSNKGDLLRHKLAEIVFSDEKALSVLNKITHKYIVGEINDEINKRNDGIVVIDAPLLFQTGLDSLCDLTVSVIADRATRKKRIMVRDSLSDSLAEKRMASQEDNEFFVSRSDYIIENNTTGQEFIKKINDIFKEIM